MFESDEGSRHPGLASPSLDLVWDWLKCWAVTHIRIIILKDFFGLAD